MSIHDEIRWRCEEGRLFRREPFVLGDPERREVHVSPELERLLQGASPDPAERRRWIALRADIDQFISGPVVYVARDPRRAKRIASMARLEASRDEVWELRSLTPRPSLRVFGCFAAKDVFIALRWQYRFILQTRPGEWDFCIKVCRHDWRTLFVHDPHSGRYPDDYITGAALDRDR